MRVGLFFGSFNPVHTGHCIIASHIVQHTDLDQVWFVVSPQNPFKPSASLLNEYHRLHLVQLAIEGEKKLRASDIEFGLPKPSYTIDTLTFLQEKYPDHDFSLVLGSDSLQNLHKWKNAALIAKNHPLYVYLRPGFDANTILDANIITVKAPLLEISSTHIREMLKKGLSPRYLLPDRVLGEVERYKYYR